MRSKHEIGLQWAQKSKRLLKDTIASKILKRVTMTHLKTESLKQLSKDMKQNLFRKTDDYVY